LNKSESMNLLTVAVYDDDDDSMGDQCCAEVSIDLNYQDLSGSIETKAPVCFQVAKGGKATGNVYLSLAAAEEAGAEKP
jgi:hypothetical protein